MKKQILALVIGLVIFSVVNAANGNNDKNDSKTAARNEKAIRDFHRQYKNAANETWYTTKDGFKVEFITNDHHTTSVYSKRGHWLYSIEQYNTDNLTTDLINTVKTQYDQYYILSVKKIIVPATDPIYVVKLEGKDSYKTIKIDKNDIELLEDFKKG